GAPSGPGRGGHGRPGAAGRRRGRGARAWPWARRRPGAWFASARAATADPARGACRLCLLPAAGVGAAGRRAPAAAGHRTAGRPLVSTVAHRAAGLPASLRARLPRATRLLTPKAFERAPGATFRVPEIQM